MADQTTRNAERRYRESGSTEDGWAWVSCLARHTDRLSLLANMKEILRTRKILKEVVHSMGMGHGWSPLIGVQLTPDEVARFLSGEEPPCEDCGVVGWVRDSATTTECLACGWCQVRPTQQGIYVSPYTGCSHQEVPGVGFVTLAPNQPPLTEEQMQAMRDAAANQHGHVGPVVDGYDLMMSAFEHEAHEVPPGNPENVDAEAETTEYGPEDLRPVEPQDPNDVRFRIKHDSPPPSSDSPF